MRDTSDLIGLLDESILLVGDPLRESERLPRGPQHLAPFINIVTYRDRLRDQKTMIALNASKETSRSRTVNTRQFSKRFTATTALVPPNAKALLMATLIGRARA